MAGFNFNILGQNAFIPNNIFGTNPQFAITQMPNIIGLGQNLNFQQSKFMLSVLSSDKLNVSVLNGTDILKFSAGYLTTGDSFNFQPNFSNPKANLSYFGALFGLPSNKIAILEDAAEENKGNKEWLKKMLAWLGKNWTYVASGVITAAQLIQQSKTAATGTGLNTTGTGLNTGTGLGTGISDIPIVTGSGNTTLTGIGQTIVDNLIPISLIGGLLFYAFSDSNPKK